MMEETKVDLREVAEVADWMSSNNSFHMVGAS